MKVVKTVKVKESPPELKPPTFTPLSEQNSDNLKNLDVPAPKNKQNLPTEELTNDPKELYDSLTNDVEEVDEPPAPSPKFAAFSEHTETLIKAESDRILNLLMGHIKELNSSLNEKIDELEQLIATNTVKVDPKNYIVRTPKVSQNLPSSVSPSQSIINSVRTSLGLQVQAQEDVDKPSKLEISYDMKMEDFDLFMNDLGGVIEGSINEFVPQLKQSIIDDIRHRLSHDKKMILENRHVSLVNASIKDSKKTVKHIKRKIKQADAKEAFIVDDGNVLKTIGDLYSCLVYMDDNLFEKYVNSDKNDFAQWVENVFDEKELARVMRKFKDRITLVKELQDWIKSHD